MTTLSLRETGWTQQQTDISPGTLEQPHVYILLLYSSTETSTKGFCCWPALKGYRDSWFFHLQPKISFQCPTCQTAKNFSICKTLWETMRRNACHRSQESSLSFYSPHSAVAYAIHSTWSFWILRQVCKLFKPGHRQKLWAKGEDFLGTSLPLDMSWAAFGFPGFPLKWEAWPEVFCSQPVALQIQG